MLMFRVNSFFVNIFMSDQKTYTYSISQFRYAFNVALFLYSISILPFKTLVGICLKNGRHPELIE